jgi:protein CpxP
MKKTLIAAAASAVILPVVILAAPGHWAKHGDHMIERMSEKLELTAEQKSQVEALFKEQHEKRKALHEETHARLTEILTNEQEAKLGQMREDRKQRWLEKRKHRKQMHQQDTNE